MTPNSEEQLERMKKSNLSQQTVELAKYYRWIGLQQPQQKYIDFQKNYYQKKYKLQSTILQQLPICVVMLGYQNIQYNRYKLGINSVFRQNYSNYKIIYFDDASPDGTAEAVQKYVKQKNFDLKKFIFVKNSHNLKTNANHFIASQKYCGYQDLYFLLDADDAILGILTFKLFNFHFQMNDIWIGWGNFIYTKHDYLGFCEQFHYEKYINVSYRNSNDWVTSHPKVFYNKLLRNVRAEDRQHPENKTFMQTSADPIMMYPMVEMAGKKLKYLPQIFYIYVEDKGNTEGFSYGNQPTEHLKYVKSIQRYKELECLFQVYDQLGNCIKAKDFVLKTNGKLSSITKYLDNQF